jgi:hypothetical protein
VTNEWLLIPLTVIAFVLIGCALLAGGFGAWLVVNWVVGRVKRSLESLRPHRTQT